MDDIRLDKYLWAVRVFKTRSDAADAVRNNKVTVNGAYAKPSREVKIGDVIAVRRMQVTYSYKVLDLVSSRPAGQERSPVLPQRHAAGGAGQTQRSARDRLRIPRPRHGPPHQEGAPRAGRPDGRTLLRRRVGAHPAARPRHAGNGYPPPLKTAPEGGRPAIPPTADAPPPKSRRIRCVHTARRDFHGETAENGRFLRNTQKRKTGPFRASTKARFPVSYAGRHLFLFSATSC